MQTNPPEYFVTADFVISEAGLASVLSRESEYADIAFLTAFCLEIPLEENRRRNKELQAKIKARGLFAYHVIGHWQASQDSTVAYKGCPENAPPDTIEEVFMLIKRTNVSRVDFQAHILSFVKEYGQECALVKQDEFYYLHFRDGTQERNDDRSRFSIAQAYSQHVKKLDIPFVFEGLLVPGSISGYRVAKNEGIVSTILPGLLVGEILSERIERLPKS